MKKLSRFIPGLLLIVGLAFTATVVWAAAAASDNAANGAYSNGWQGGDNGGSGWGGGWTLTGTANSGLFIGSSTGNGDGDGNTDGDINTAGNTAWGLFANSGTQANATRPFNGPLRPGDRLTLQMDTGFVGGGGTVGFSLWNASGQNVFETYFTGGAGNYTFNDNAGATDSGLGFTDEGLAITVTLITSDTYQAVVRHLNGGTTVTRTGTLINAGAGRAISQLRLFNVNAGVGGTQDLFFNNLTVTPAQCWATPDNGTTVYGSIDASAVQSATSAASAGGTVKIAGYCAGVSDTGGSIQTVLITKTLTLAGGYTTTNWSTANLAANPTTLDAQGGGRVVSSTSTALGITLQGFTVTNGYISTTLNVKGAGIFANGPVTLTDLLVHNNILTGNLSQNGGGIFAFSTARITNTIFSANQARGGGGGAYFSLATSVSGAIFSNNLTGNSGGGAAFGSNVNANLTNTTFTSNTAISNGGGAFFNLGTTANITDTTFSANRASNDGGGAYFSHRSSLLNTTFSTNQANSDGGGAHFGFMTQISATTFSTNTATSGGGVVVVAGGSGSTHITNTIFRANTANNGGGVVFGGGAAAQLVNVLFARNRAATTNAGAAIEASSAFPLQLIHVTIVSPTQASPAAIYVGGGTVYITNTIIASHTVGIQQNGGTVTQNNNLFYGNQTNLVGNVGGGSSPIGDPAFFDTTNYTLTAASAAIDIGTNAGVPSDYFGNARPQGGGYDVGYAEAPFTAPAPGPATCFTEYTGNNVTDFSSADASAVRLALAAVSPGGTVKVAGYCAGVAVQGPGNTQVAVITNPVTLAGGYTTTNWLGVPNPTVNATTLDAQGGGRVLYATVATTLQGFTATNGYINAGALSLNGGGIFAANALTLTDMAVYSNTITGTAGTQQGGGVFATSATLVTNTIFSNNTARSNGGGGRFTALTALSTTFQDNLVTSVGGGVYASGFANLGSTTFQRNTSTANLGGGAYFQAGASLTGTAFLSNTGQAFQVGNLVMTNTVLQGNQAPSQILYIGAGGSQVSIVNSLFANNLAPTIIYADVNSTTYLTHTTIVSTTRNGTAIILNGTLLSVSNSIIVSFTTGINRAAGTAQARNTLFFNNTTNTSGGAVSTTAILSNPTFLDPANGNYHLSALSPAIDAGVAAGPAFDIDGDPRPWGLAPDVGYDEVRRYISIQSNNWGLSGTWDVNSVPNDVRAVVLISQPHTVTVENHFQANHLTVRGGLVVDQGNVLTVSLPVSNAGVIRMIRPVPDGSLVAFEIPSGGAFPAYRLADVKPGANLGVVTTTVWGLLGNEYCTTTGASSLPAYARRCFEITPTITNVGASVYLWVLNSELVTITTPYVYRFIGFWEKVTDSRQTGVVGDYTWVRGDPIGFSFFLVGEDTNAPTTVTLTTFTATNPGGAWGLLALAGLALLAAVGGWWWQRRPRAATPKN